MNAVRSVAAEPLLPSPWIRAPHSKALLHWMVIMRGGALMTFPDNKSQDIPGWQEIEYVKNWIQRIQYKDMINKCVVLLRWCKAELRHQQNMAPRCRIGIVEPKIWLTWVFHLVKDDPPAGKAVWILRVEFTFDLYFQMLKQFLIVKFFSMIINFRIFFSRVCLNMIRKEYNCDPHHSIYTVPCHNLAQYVGEKSILSNGFAQIIFSFSELAFWIWNNTWNNGKS